MSFLFLIYRKCFKNFYLNKIFATFFFRYIHRVEKYFKLQKKKTFNSSCLSWKIFCSKVCDDKHNVAEIVRVEEKFISLFIAKIFINQKYFFVGVNKNQIFVSTYSRIRFTFSFWLDEQKISEKNSVFSVKL